MVGCLVWRVWFGLERGFFYHSAILTNGQVPYIKIADKIVNQGALKSCGRPFSFGPVRFSFTRVTHLASENYVE